MAASRALAAVTVLLLAGCLEVEQHPPHVDGAYDGKPDALPEQRFFGGDTAVWQATRVARQQLQNEYNRTER